MTQVERYPLNRRGSHVPPPNNSQPSTHRPAIRSPPPQPPQPTITTTTTTPRQTPITTTTISTQEYYEPPVTSKRSSRPVRTLLGLGLLWAAAFVVIQSLRPYCDGDWWCVPCPLNADCEGRQVRCLEGHKLVGGWIRPAQCIKDIKKAGKCLAYLRAQAADEL